MIAAPDSVRKALPRRPLQLDDVALGIVDVKRRALALGDAEEIQAHL